MCAGMSTRLSLLGRGSPSRWSSVFFIRDDFGGDPADGSLFLFVNRRRDRIKALWWDGDGFVLWYKRLEQGTFETVPSRSGEERVQIDSTQLAMILGGVRLETVERRKRYHRRLV
jgi:transposase